MNQEIKLISEAYLGMLDEAIKGWKHAGADLVKARAAARHASDNVKLVSLKKDGGESKMHNAAKTFSSEEDARKHHKNITELNPKSSIKHNLYVDGKLKEVLG